MNDPVNKPSHYTFGKIEVIEAIEDWKLDFHRANAVKYVARAGKKNPDTEIQDLEKAVWYLNRKIKKLKEKRNNPEATPTPSNGSPLRESIERLKKDNNY